jgi:hypothetical protein
VSGILHEFRRHLFHGQHMVDKTAGNRASEYGVVLGGFQDLCPGHARRGCGRPRSRMCGNSRESCSVQNSRRQGYWASAHPQRINVT